MSWERKQPMPRGSGFKRPVPGQGSSLSRGGRMSRAARPRASRARVPAPAGALAEALAEVLACRDTVATAARVYGCDRGALEQACRRAVRAACMKRDGWACQNCGEAACDVQHRIRRGMGGTSDPVIAFGMCNLVALCRECHDKADRKRDTEMHALGFWLETDQDPAAVPVVALTRSGRVVRWPLADGSWSAESPEGLAA